MFKTHICSMRHAQREARKAHLKEGKDDGVVGQLQVFHVRRCVGILSTGCELFALAQESRLYERGNLRLEMNGA